MSRYDDLSDSTRRLVDDLAEMLAAANARPAQADPGAHAYLSTGCLHGEHAYCQAKTGQAGVKTPARCKFCGAHCECPCHAPGAVTAVEAAGPLGGDIVISERIKKLVDDAAGKDHSESGSVMTTLRMVLALYRQELLAGGSGETEGDSW